jgi:hypothetical protein
MFTWQYLWVCQIGSPNNKENNNMHIKETLRNRRGLVASLAAVVALGGAAAGTLGGFSATIVNPTNTFASGTLQLEESSASTACYSTGTGSGGTVNAANSATCSTINKLGNALLQEPGGTDVTTPVTLTNVGNVASSELSLTPDATCTVSASSDNGGYTGADTAGYCALVDVTITNTDTSAVVFSGTLATLAGHAAFNLGSLAAGGADNFSFAAHLDSSATNADQGLVASLPLTWNLAQ